MSEREKKYSVHGTVTGINGQGLPDARVKVWWQRIRESILVAEGETSEEGKYHLRYDLPAHAAGKKLIVVEVHSRHLESPLSSAPTASTSKKSVQIDLQAEPRDDSDFATMIRAIRPLLDRLAITDVVENSEHQDITFLANELNKTTEQIMRVVVAERLQVVYKIPAAAFYAFLSQRVPATLPKSLIDASQSFTLIVPLVHNVGSMICGLTADTQKNTITSAIALNIIGERYTKQIDEIVKELGANRVNDLLTQPYLSGNTSLSQLLDVTVLPKEKQQAFSEALAANSEPMSTFWTNLASGKSGFTSKEATSIEQTLSIGSLVRNYLPIVQNLTQGFSSGKYSTLADLARLNVNDWVDVVNKTGTPPGIDPAGDTSAAQIFATVVYNRITQAYPTVALSTRIISENLASEAIQKPLVQFFNNNSDLELINNNIPVYLSDKGEAAFKGINERDRDAVVATARSFQRVLRLSPSVDVSQNLIKMGLDSATKITRMGDQQFFNKATAAGMTKPEAGRVFNTATQRYASVVGLYMKMNFDARGVAPAAMGSNDEIGRVIGAAINRDQSLSTLFGSQDYCLTCDCTSVLSPAAYLCDLLLWLRNHPEGSQTALDVLDARRPDIRNLLLNCPNTDTELPYIDLVNELLADKISPPVVISTTLTSAIDTTQTTIQVAGDSGFAAPNFYVNIGSETLLVTGVSGVGNATWAVLRGQKGTTAAAAASGTLVTPSDATSAINPLWKQTSESLTAAQLAAAPEYFNQGAYITLFEAHYPQALPYSTGLDGLRTYLQHWNLPLWQLRQALLPPAPTPGDLADVAAEYFGLNITAETILTTSNTTTAYLKTVWNTANFTASAGTGLASVPVFLQAAALSYEELLEFLEVSWVQGGLNIGIQGINDSCDTSVQSLSPAPLNHGFLDRANRFLRLWLCSPYKMWEIDLLLNAPSVGNGLLNQDTLIALQAFGQLQTATRLAVDEQLAFYQDLDTASHRDTDGTETTSLYAQIFLDPAIAWTAPDPDLEILLTPGGALNQPLLNAQVHLASIQAALGVSAANAALLIALTDNQFNLANLSMIYRVTGLATASGFSISDLLSIAKLLNPAAPDQAAAIAPLLASPAATLAFLKQAKNIQLPGLSVDAITYLVTPPSASNPAGWATTSQMTAANITTTLTAVRQAVLNLMSVSTTLASAITAAATTITVANSTGFPAVPFFINIGAEVLQVTAMSGAGNKTWTVVRAQLGSTAAAAANGAAVTPNSADINGSVIATVAANAHTDNGTGLANDVTAILLNTLDTPGTPNALLVTLTDPAFISSANPVTQANFPAQFLAIQLFDKAAVLVRSMRLVATDLTWLIANATVYSGLDFTQLPVQDTQAQMSLSALLNTLLLIKQARLFNLAPPSATIKTLYDVIGGINTGTLASESQAQAAISVITAWPLSDIKAFAAKLGLTFPASYTQPAVYDSLRTLEVMAAAIAAGNSVDTVVTALAAPIDNVQTSITVTSSAGFPAPDFYIYIGSEILNVTAVSGPGSTTWTVTRGQQGTTAAAAQTGDVITLTSGAGAQMVYWATVPQNEVFAEEQAASALGALKAQQAGNDVWLTLAPTFMNPIRQRRSNALQAYLISQRNGAGNLIYGDTDGLFNYFLIDVQMSPCQVTSRVVQAYIAVQIFVERCLMNLEAPAVKVNPHVDDTWSQWEWMKRYRIWEANREVFLFPENWLIESQRPNRTEIYQKFEQEVRQGQSTADYLETVVLNYIDRFDGLAHPRVTGTCEDPSNGAIYVVARTHADPPTFYMRSFENNAWTGWEQIPLDIKAQQVVPALYRGRVCLFWTDVKVSNEPSQQLPPPLPSGNAPAQDVERYVTLGIFFSMFRNGSWSPVQASKGKLFDKPLISVASVSDTRSIAALYSIKVQTPLAANGYGQHLWVDIFRFGDYDANEVAIAESFLSMAQTLENDATQSGVDATVKAILEDEANLFTAVADSLEALATSPTAVHVGRAVFDGRFGDLELNNLNIAIHGDVKHLFPYALSTYGPDAQSLLPLVGAEPDLIGEPFMIPKAGALETMPASAGGGANQTAPLIFTPPGGHDIGIPFLLGAAPIPFRLVGPNNDLRFDPTSYFFFQDNRRCYYVEAPKYYWTGTTFSPAVPSDPGTVPYEIIYQFHPFYYPFTGLFWNQLAGGGFDLLYDPKLQQNPDQVDPSGAEVFSFASGYSPLGVVKWDRDDVTNQDRQFLDFRSNATHSVYNWELFYHVPLYIAQLLSQNQQFEDAQKWFNYIFNPSRQSTDPVPQRFWIPKPLHDLNSAQILQQQIEKLLSAVNQGDPNDVAQVRAWRNNPFNPFVLADMRNGVPYMKSTVMSYLDNLIAWADNLFASESREALSEATLIYVIAAEILGKQPEAVIPPKHADESYNQLEPKLDAFANAMVEIENVIGAGGGNPGPGGNNGMPSAETFYFKIPPNEQLLGYWKTIADRLYKLRHCQNIAGAPLQLALFDAPIDPGLLIRAQAAGVDLSSVLSDLSAPLPNYRFTSLFTLANEYVGAVTSYGTLLQGALEKIDTGALSLLQQNMQQQLLVDGNDVLNWQVQQAQSNLDALFQTLAIAQQKYDYNNSQDFANAAEIVGTSLNAASGILKIIAAATTTVGAVAAVLPNFTVGAAGFGGSPVATVNDGGVNAGNAGHMAGISLTTIAEAAEIGASLSNTIGSWQHRKDNWSEAAKEAQIDIAQVNLQIQSSQFALQIAQRNQANHQEQIDNIQKEIDFLTDKFTSNSLYDWMVGSLSATYFQAYQLAYQLCKQVERCYQFELGIFNSSFIQFGYWDSLHKGLMSGETLNHDLRRMQASYYQQNVRRYELNRWVSLASINPLALQQLLTTGACDFKLQESLFDNDYPGHYNRRIVRMSMTVVYPTPGKFDNIRATLTLVANQVRVNTDTSSGYQESPVGSDPRFIYNYAANSQRIAMGNGQDDPGLFNTSISSNVTDARYLPFENAGAISSWHLEMPQLNNEVDLSTVGDIMLHVYYTALDGGGDFQDTVVAYNNSNLPTSGVKVFSAQNDFATSWTAFFAKPTVTPPPQQLLSLAIPPTKFPAWTRGKTIVVTSINVVSVAWEAGNFVVVPQSPLPTAPVVMSPVTATTPNLCTATITMPPNTGPGTWVFELQKQGAADFSSLTKNDIGDVLLLINFNVV